MWSDLRDSVRSLRKTPAFTILAVFVLALGIGVNTAIFSLVNAVLFRAPAVSKPDELRYLYLREERVSIPVYPDYRDLQAQNDVFSDLVAISATSARLGSGVEVEVVSGEAVSANYFDALGVRMALGHPFVPSEDEASNPSPTVIISYRLWQRRFHGEQNVIGQNLALTRPRVAAEDQWPNYTIIGVAAEGFAGVTSPWSATDFWVPIVQRTVDYRHPWGAPVMIRIDARDDAAIGLMIGRLKPGVSTAQAQSAVASLSQQLRLARHSQYDHWSLSVLDSRQVRLPFDPRGQMVPERLAAGLMVVSGLVLVIAVANLAGMLMARGVMRRNEMAIRLMLGASRWQIARRLLNETFLLAVAGGVGGLWLAYWLLVVFANQTPNALGIGLMQTSTTPFSLDLSIDAHVLAYTALLCLGAGLLVGVAPARAASKTDLLNVISGGLAHSSRRRVRVRHLILIPQICLCAALLLVAGVVAKPVLKAEGIDPGYEPGTVSFANFAPAPTNRTAERTAITASEATARAYYDEQRQKRRVFNQRVLEILKEDPSISSAALTMGLPTGSLSGFVIPRDSYPKGPYWWVSQAYVSPGYFTTLGMRVTKGRDFQDSDRADAPPVAILDERLAMWLFQGGNPIGQYVAQKRMDYREPTWLEIVGVVNEVQPPLEKLGGNPFVYLPLGQASEQAMTLVARGAGSTGTVTRAIRQAIFDADPLTDVMNTGTLRDQISSMLYPRRMAAGILAASGLIGLILAAAGLYGVISYSVEQRVRELGIRATLGASRFALMGLVLREGAAVALVGALLGFVVALIGGYLTSHLVIAIPRPDLTTILIVPALLALVVLIACFVPARRAARVDPLQVLKA